MKVLLANKFFFRNGGSEVVMFQERDYLLGNGHEVVDFSMQDERNLASPYASNFVTAQDYRGDGNVFRKLGSAFAFVHSRQAAAKFGELLDQTRPDLVHCHNIYHQLTPSIIGVAAKRRVPVVLTLHDYKPVCPVYTRMCRGQPCSACLNGEFRRVLKNRCADGFIGKSALLYAEAAIQRHLGSYEKVHTFIAPSRFMKNAVAHRIPAERIHVLYNGVESPPAIGGTDRGYVLYLGRLSAEKGIPTLLAAHARSGGRWLLRVAGTGPLEGELYRQFPLAEYLGHLGGTALADIIANASIIVVPSEWYENCPMSVLEAMAYGKPVVGSRIGGIPELVAEGVSGRLFEPGRVDQLSTILDELMARPDLRQRMGEAARLRIANEYSLARHHAGLMEVYRGAL